MTVFNKTACAASVVLFANAAFGQTVVTTVFSNIDFDKVCKSHSTAGYALDVNALACGPKGDKCKTLTTPADVRKFVLMKHAAQLKLIGEGKDPNLRLMRGNACSVSPSGSDVYGGVCGPIQCVAYSGKAVAAKKDDEENLFETRFLLRKTAKDLLETDIKKAGRAGVELKDDFKGDGDFLELKAAAGFVAETWLVGDDKRKLDKLTLVPFIAAERIEFESKPDITNLSFGATAGLAIYSLAQETGWSHNFQAKAAVLSDEELNNSTLIGSLSYQPEIAGYGNLFSSGARMGPLRLLLRPNLQAAFGYVLDESDTAPLPDGTEYLRAGGGLKAILFGDHPTDNSSLINNFSLSANYRFEHFITGPENNFERFEVTLGFQLPSAPNFGFDLSYVTGDVDPTLENVDFITASFGVKF